MQFHSQTQRKRSLAATFALLGISFAAGFSPVMFNLSVDPYQVFWKSDRPTAINDLAEKSHYPLWKLAKYKPGKHDTLILGDSRARALRDKYWHEAGVPTALNLAYGGGTIPEIYATFKFLQNDNNIRRLVIGIQLRSFDEDHKGGMNRVPEAVNLLSNRFNYLKNWHVAETSFNIFKAENPDALEQINGLSNQLSISAKANDLGTAGQTPLAKLLEPKVCFGCDLPENLKSVPYVKTGVLRGRYHGRGYGHLFNGIGHGFYDSNNLPEYYRIDLAALPSADTLRLPKKFARQVKKNGTADWRKFQVSSKYWTYLESLSGWAKNHDVELFFVIPPTITAMQKTIISNGLGNANHTLRVRLSKLGKVVDLDFPNSLTADVANFTDAYHFNSKVARAITEQVIIQFENAPKSKARKYAFDLKCLPANADDDSRFFENQTRLMDGVNCRIWEEQS